MIPSPNSPRHSATTHEPDAALPRPVGAPARRPSRPADRAAAAAPARPRSSRRCRPAAACSEMARRSPSCTTWPGRTPATARTAAATNSPPANHQARASKRRSTHSAQPSPIPATTSSTPSARFSSPIVSRKPAIAGRPSPSGLHRDHHPERGARNSSWARISAVGYFACQTSIMFVASSAPVVPATTRLNGPSPAAMSDARRASDDGERDGEHADSGVTADKPAEAAEVHRGRQQRRPVGGRTAGRSGRSSSSAIHTPGNRAPGVCTWTGRSGRPAPRR